MKVHRIRFIWPCIPRTPHVLPCSSTLAYYCEKFSYETLSHSERMPRCRASTPPTASKSTPTTPPTTAGGALSQGKASSPLQGDYTPEQALERMLQGSGLVAVPTGERQYRLQPGRAARRRAVDQHLQPGTRRNHRHFALHLAAVHRPRRPPGRVVPAGPTAPRQLGRHPWRTPRLGTPGQHQPHPRQPPGDHRRGHHRSRLVRLQLRHGPVPLCELQRVVQAGRRQPLRRLSFRAGNRQAI